jgi:pimeloyl-ACP methyl ester carboxylesterase
LPDGRVLAFTESGDPQGWPVFFCHGFAGSRLQRHPDDGLAKAAGVRLIAIDRPGIGESDRLPGRRIIDWPADVAAAADALHTGQFSVFGWSAGAPHALACAHAMPHRVIAVALASPMAGWLVGPGAHADAASLQSRRLARLTGIAPWALPMLLRPLARRARRNPARAVGMAARSLPPTDQAIVAQPDVRAMLIETLGEAFRRGSAGVADDVIACARPWGFDPAAVTVPTYLWHGMADRTIPVAWGRQLADRLPSCQPTWLPGAGHFLVLSIWSSILSTLAAASQRRASRKPGC